LDIAKDVGYVDIIKLFAVKESQKSLEDEIGRLENENKSLKEDIAIWIGRDCIRQSMTNRSTSYSKVAAKDIPIGYVKYCTAQFSISSKLGEGGSGEVYLAMDNYDSDIVFVAKRIHARDVQSFQRELEVRWYIKN